MEDTTDALFQRQIDSELKNALKSEERKKIQKRKIAEKKDCEPPKKKEKKSNSIPVSVRDVEAIRGYFWTQICYLPLLKKVALWSGLCNETMAFASYPILLGPPVKKDGRSHPTDYVLGVPRPTIILSGLRELFSQLYPERNAMDYSLWDVYKYNRQYYSVKVEKCSFSQEVFELQMVETKPFGGPKDASSVHWLEENKLKRFGRAISIADFLKDKDISKMKRPKIPEGAKPWPSDHLNKINERVEEMKRQLLLAEETAKNELQKKDIKEAMENLKDQDDSDDASSSAEE